MEGVVSGVLLSVVQAQWRERERERESGRGGRSTGCGDIRVDVAAG